MVFLWVILLVALMIPIMGILVDSPIGRALGRRLEGPQVVAPPGLTELAQKVELLESEMDDLTISVESLREENQFLQRLLEDSASQRPSLPPPSNP